MTEDKPKRKRTRLKDFDYNSAGCYFVTMCTKDRKCILGNVVVGHDVLGVPQTTRDSKPYDMPDNAVVGHDVLGVPQTELSYYGKVVEKWLLTVSNDPYVELDTYVIMPNHVHAIVRVKERDDAIQTKGGVPRTSRPTNHMSRVISFVKRSVNRELGRRIWQASFYDRVIRNEEEYARIWEYIEANPFNWLTDEYYV